MTVSNGILSAIRTAEKRGTVLQITAPISPGSSGGPLFNMAGDVIGVTAASVEGGQNLNFAVPINEVKRLLRPEYTKIGAFPDEPSSTGDAAVRQGSNGPVCGFITTRILEEVPQVPTSCKQKGASEADVYSPTDVFEGSMRRAWSTALFRAIQDSVSSGPCGGERGCQISVSDSRMSQENVHFIIGIDRDLVSLLGKEFKDSFSDEWYLAWWINLVKIAPDSPGSMGNAGLRAKAACQAYTAIAGVPGLWPSPKCSTLLNTGGRVDIILDFENSLEATSANNASLLLTTFGTAFDLSGYQGDVIIRTPWNNGFRTYLIYPLRVVCLFWEETQSGSRDKAAATLDAMRNTVEGQQEKRTLSPARKKDGLLFRSAAVVRIFPDTDDDGSLADLTDGSEWIVSKDSSQRCGLEVGSQISVVAVGGNSGLSLKGSGQGCDLNAKFVRGW